MDHNQTVVDQYLQKVLSTEPRIVAVDLFEAVKGQLNPQLDLAEFRLAISKWFNEGPLSHYKSSKGRFGGIKLANEEDRVARVKSNEPSNSGESLPADETTEDESEESLIIYLTPSIRIHQPDSRNWAIQKKNGDMWISQYYQNSLDAIIGSYIRRALNGEFKVSSEKISDLKELKKLIISTQKSLEESLKAIIVEKVA